MHTVGPIANGYPTAAHRVQLGSCYRSCMDAALAYDMHSIAFCCISTGVFGFPQKAAAQIAVSTVRTWLSEHPEANIVVIFNVFGEADEQIYRYELRFEEDA